MLPDRIPTERNFLNKICCINSGINMEKFISSQNGSHFYRDWSQKLVSLFDSNGWDRPTYYNGRYHTFCICGHALILMFFDCDSVAAYVFESDMGKYRKYKAEIWGRALEEINKFINAMEEGGYGSTSAA